MASTDKTPRAACPTCKAKGERLKALAFEEAKWARIGGRPWAEFVRRCERELGLPWSMIREDFDLVPGRFERRSSGG